MVFPLAVVALGVGHAADLGDLVHLRGETGELAGHMGAGDFGFDAFDRPLDFLVIRAEVEGIEMAHPAVHEKVDHAVRGRVAGDGYSIFSGMGEAGADRATEQAFCDAVDEDTAGDV